MKATFINKRGQSKGRMKVGGTHFFKIFDLVSINNDEQISFHFSPKYLFNPTFIFGKCLPNKASYKSFITEEECVKNVSLLCGLTRSGRKEEWNALYLTKSVDTGTPKTPGFYFSFTRLLQLLDIMDTLKWK